ncbi:hypothetical protein WR25_16583 [Diploscapter pachys]|uniref:Fucosyltransferase n=1 Tax=Diploscapter pachys TaxID=2018661 RepID=A0A2A2LAB5_9BILA|nr:hypothetical protein WR25_16583 [Diploscapter pachys]
MRIRPAAVYRYLFLFFGASLLLYGIYSIFAYDDGSHVPVHKAQKHLYLTVSRDRIGHRFDTLAPKRILFWTKVFDRTVKPESDNFADCPGLTDRCIMDSDKSLISKADAVVFHSADISKEPLPENSLRNPDQVYVYYSMETPDNSGKLSVSKNFFNWTATFVHDSDVVAKYGGYFMKTTQAEAKGFKIQRFFVDERRFVKKNSGVFWLVSNCKTESEREMAIAELGKYIDVKYAGKCANDVEGKSLCPLGDPCNSIFESYPFYVAIENTVCKDYITEKLFSRIDIPSIPIVMKRKTYEDANIPPSLFIALDDFKGPKEMAEYLKMLQTNMTAYKKHMTWRQDEWTMAPWNAPGFRNGMCRLCERLWEANRTSKSIEDIESHYKQSAACENDNSFVKKWIS